MKKNCRRCTTSFEISENDMNFYDKVSPIFGGKKFAIPAPNRCPDCRQQRRIAFKNERFLYQRECDLCAKNMLSIYAPVKSSEKNEPYTVYCQSCWWSDAWDPTQFGREIDFSKSFMAQFQALDRQVPQLSMVNATPENSEYCNATTGMKNSYLCFNAVFSEDCYYGKGLSKCRNTVDCLKVYDCELCYECVDSHRCYHCFYLQNCIGCRDASYCFDCIGCADCFGCAGLRNKQYYIFNKAYSKSEYTARVQKLQQQGKSVIQKHFQETKRGVPHKFSITTNSESCSGDYLYESKEAHFSYDIVQGEQLKYCYDLREKSNTSHDIASFGNNIELSYEAHSSGFNMQQCAFVDYCWQGVHDLYYSRFCHYDTSHSFGCAGLRRKQYCILNKPYTKDEYEALVLKIIEKMIADGEWGEFFPASLSPFGYNETVANEYYPLTKDEALAKNFNWSDYEPPKPEVKKIITASKLPDNIKDIPDDILNWAIECEVTKKPFRIIKQELEFYREHNLPVPKRHPDQRHKDRMALRNPRKLWDRNCMKCNTPIQTTYAPSRPEMVYCEACYLTEVY